MHRIKTKYEYHADCNDDDDDSQQEDGGDSRQENDYDSDAGE